MSNSETGRFEWSKAEKGWKSMKENRMIPFNEMSNSDLKKTFKLACKKELEHYNRSQVFADKQEEMLEEAERRGLALKVLDTDFHYNKFKKRFLPKVSE